MYTKLLPVRAFPRGAPAFRDPGCVSDADSLICPQGGQAQCCKVSDVYWVWHYCPKLSGALLVYEPAVVHTAWRCLSLPWMSGRLGRTDHRVEVPQQLDTYGGTGAGCALVCRDRHGL